MRTAGLPTFRKLYDKVEDMPLQPGKHSITIWNNDASGQKSKYLYPVHSFSGSKSIVLSTSSWIGGKNGFLGGGALSACGESGEGDVDFPAHLPSPSGSPPHALSAFVGHTILSTLHPIFP